MKLNLLFIIAMTLVLIVPGGVFANHTGSPSNGDDVLEGHLGKDKINARAGNDFVAGESFDDINNNLGGDDDLKGGTGQDELDGGPGNDMIRGGDDPDYLVGDDGFDEVVGGMGNDLLLGGNNGDTIDAGTGDDTAYGNGGNDSIKGGAGNDNLVGGPGDDSVNGQAGDDNIDGGLGDDRLFAGSGDDGLFGDRGNDLLVGNLLAGITTFDCGEGDEGPNGITNVDGDIAWWDGGDGTILDDLGDSDPLNDIVADDILPINCENVFNLASPAEDDPEPPGDAPPQGGEDPPPTPDPEDTAIKDLKAIMDTISKSDLNNKVKKDLQATLDDAEALFVIGGIGNPTACLKLVEFENQVLDVPDNKLSQDAEDAILTDLPASLNFAGTGTKAVKGC